MRRLAPTGLQDRSPDHTEDVRTVWISAKPAVESGQPRSTESVASTSTQDVENAEQEEDETSTMSTTTSETDPQGVSMVTVEKDLPQPLQDAVCLPENVLARLPTSVRQTCEEQMATTITSGVKMFMTGITHMLGAQAREFEVSLEKVLKVERQNIRQPLQLRIEELEVELKNAKGLLETNVTLESDLTAVKKQLTAEQESHAVELAESRKLREDDQAIYERDMKETESNTKELGQAYQESQASLREGMKILGLSTKDAITDRDNAIERLRSFQTRFMDHYGFSLDNWASIAKFTPTTLTPIISMDTTTVSMTPPGYNTLDLEPAADSREMVATVEAIIQQQSPMDLGVIPTPVRPTEQDIEFSKIHDFVMEDMGTLDEQNLILDHGSSLLIEEIDNRGIEMPELSTIDDDNLD